MTKSKWGVYIGRFQPFHNGHLASLTKTLSMVDNLIVLLGSSQECRTDKNPWDFSERREILVSCLAPEDRDRVYIGAIIDYNDDDAWVSSVESKVVSLTGDEPVKIFGLDKDASTYYLNKFPNWEYVEVVTNNSVNATTVRHLIRTGDPSWENLVPIPVRDWINNHPWLNTYTI